MSDCPNYIIKEIKQENLEVLDITYVPKVDGHEYVSTTENLFMKIKQECNYKEEVDVNDDEKSADVRSENPIIKVEIKQEHIDPLNEKNYDLNGDDYEYQNVQSENPNNIFTDIKQAYNFGALDQNEYISNFHNNEYISIIDFSKRPELIKNHQASYQGHKIQNERIELIKSCQTTHLDSGRKLNKKGKPKSNIGNHSVEKPFKCDLCSKQFDRKTYLNLHMKIHTGEKPHKCNICNKEFVQKKTLDSHMGIHTGEKSYKCDFCHELFSRKSHLKAHQQIHVSEKPFKCDICKKQFGRKRYLSYHMQIHTSDKPYKCDKCSKQFRHNHLLNMHLQSHSGEKPFHCNLCHKGFGRKSNLNAHMRTHTGTKPFKCDICTKKFGRKSHLNYHMLIHRDEKPYKCNLCSKQFRHKQLMNVHIQTHTGEGKT